MFLWGQIIFKTALFDKVPYYHHPKTWYNYNNNNKNRYFISDSLVENESLSSGVGTSSHSGSAGSSTTPTETPSVILPGMHVVCLENFSNPDLANGLHISQGDIIEGEKSYLVNRVFSTNWL